MFSLRVALRYLLSKKSHNAVNILSAVSVVGVAIATMAMVIVLSVFNGFSDLAKTKLSMIDPDLLVTPSTGKVVENADSVARVIASVEGVGVAAPMVREQALAVKADVQMPVKILGLDRSGVDASMLDAITIDGEPIVEIIDLEGSALDGLSTAMLSIGVANEIGLRGDVENIVKVYVPRRRGRINTANPMTAFRSDTLVVTGVFRVDQPEYDNDVIIIPLSSARFLLDYRHGEASGIQVFLSAGASEKNVANALRSKLGDNLLILDRLQQEQESFNMIYIEKWVTLMMLVFILIITAFNIISAIYILRVEKRDNIAVMKALGASGTLIRRIFAWQGRLITLAGGAIGIFLGSTIVLAQQWGAFIKLRSSATGAYTVDSYPVRLDVTDLLIVGAIIILTALVTSYIATFSRR